MYSNTASASLRLLSAGVLDQEQLEDSERLRRLGETRSKGMIKIRKQQVGRNPFFSNSVYLNEESR